MGESGSLRTEAGVAAAYDAHGAELYRFALRALGEPGAAQDAVQDTFLRAWRAGDSYDPTVSSLRIWLFAIARNTVIDHVRRRTARPWVPVDPQDTRVADAGVPDHVDALLDAWVVQEALTRIGPEHRAAIVETYLRGRPYDEVAAEQGIPVGTLRSRVFYALKSLRSIMTETGVVP